MTPTPEDLQKLLELAEAATPGPWQACNGYEHPGALIEGVSAQHKVDVIVNDGTYAAHYNGVVKPEDAAYIAAANPEVIKRLIAKLRRYEGALRLVADQEFLGDDTAERRTSNLLRNAACAALKGES